MSKFVNIENVVVIEQTEVAGACAGFLLGAATGAKIGSTFWWSGPIVSSVTLAGSILVGGTIGVVGGSNLGKAIGSQINI